MVLICHQSVHNNLCTTALCQYLLHFQVRDFLEAGDFHGDFLDLQVEVNVIVQLRVVWYSTMKCLKPMHVQKVAD